MSIYRLPEQPEDTQPMKCLHVFNEAILLAQVFFSQLNVPLHHANVVEETHRIKRQPTFYGLMLGAGGFRVPSNDNRSTVATIATDRASASSSNVGP